MIELEQVSKYTLSDISYSIPAGQMVGLVGPDGSGKTTLLRLIAGLLLPTSGKITVAGFDTRDQAAEIHKLLGYMPQKFGLYEDLTVMQNLELYAALRGLTLDEKAESFPKLFHFTGLEPFVDRLAGALSGGMKQKLGLACALMKKPTLLLLDEPSVGVDPLSRRELWKMVQELVDKGITVIWSTTYPDEAAKCQKVIRLHEREAVPQEDSVLAETMSPIPVKNGPVIVADHLTKKFGSFTAAENISFEIRQGEIFGLLGPNGAGKSTTFKMMCGLLKPTEGKAWVNGKEPTVCRSQIGYMAQKFSLYGNLTVHQNLEFFSGVYNLEGKKQKEAIDQMVEVFSLQKYLDQTADTLPLGFKQRLALSCATMHRPAVLFLDEPTSGVDPFVRQEFWNHIQALVKKGVTIMVTTHFMIEAEYCDRIALIYQGKVIEMGSPQELKNRVHAETLEDAFIKLIEDHD